MYEAPAVGIEVGNGTGEAKATTRERGFGGKGNFAIEESEKDLRPKSGTG